MNLYQRINEVRKSIDYIQKDKSVSTGGSSYKAVTHDQVTAMVRDHMVKHGIVSYPILVESKSNPKEGEAKQFRYEATYDIVFVNADEPSDKLCIRIQAHAMDNADKACGKALSYAKKYAILKLFEIETGEDEESRYQSFDVNDWIDAIKTAKDLPELQQVYNDATNAALGAKDQNARRLIVAEKDKRKAELA
jgi:hypothetical protein